MKNIFKWLKCKLGFHNGVCVDEAFRCCHCDFTHQYSLVDFYPWM